MTTSESKGRFFNKTNRLESIRITNRIESIRIANWNALLRGDADDGRPKSVCVNVYVSWCVCEGSTVSALATAASADVISACARSPSLQLHAVDSPSAVKLPHAGDRSRVFYC